MAKISLNIVCRNEEQRIRACILDAAPWVDEVIVADQSSEDATPKIVREIVAPCPVRLISTKSYGYCEATRNVAAHHSTGDWLLILDADELMTPRLKYALRWLAETAPQSVDGWKLRRELWMDGEMAFAGDEHLRFARRDRVRFLDEPHTEPQALDWSRIRSLEYISIFHWKTTAEQLADEHRCEDVLARFPFRNETLRSQKLALNVRLAEARKAGTEPP